MQAFIVAAFGLLVTPTLVSAQAVKLEVKYTPEEKLVARSQEKINQRITIGGQDFTTAVTSTKTVLVTNSPRSDKGELTRTHTVRQMKTEMQTGNETIRFDSANPDARDTDSTPIADQIVATMKVSAKAKRVYTYDKANALIDVRIAGIDRATLPVSMKNEFKPEPLKKARLDTLKSMPGKPVSVGDSWNRVSELSLGAGQLLTLKTKYTYRGMKKLGEKEYDYVETEITDVTMSMKPGGEGPQVTESDVRPVDSKGKFWFDREAGRVVATESKMQMTGTMAMDVGGQTLNAGIDLTIQGKSEVKRQE